MKMCEALSCSRTSSRSAIKGGGHSACLDSHLGTPSAPSLCQRGHSTKLCHRHHQDEDVQGISLVKDHVGLRSRGSRHSACLHLKICDYEACIHAGDVNGGLITGMRSPSTYKLQGMSRAIKGYVSTDAVCDLRCIFRGGLSPCATQVFRERALPSPISSRRSSSSAFIPSPSRSRMPTVTSQAYYSLLSHFISFSPSLALTKRVRTERGLPSIYMIDR
jgi:hypothetical protein